MDREVLDCRGKLINAVLLNDHVLKLPYKYLYLDLQICAVSNFCQRSSQFQWVVVTVLGITMSDYITIITPTKIPGTFQGNEAKECRVEFVLKCLSSGCGFSTHELTTSVITCTGSSQLKILA